MTAPKTPKYLSLELDMIASSLASISRDLDRYDGPDVLKRGAADYLIERIGNLEQLLNRVKADVAAHKRERSA